MITRLSKSDGVIGPCGFHRNGYWAVCAESDIFCCKECYGVFDNEESYQGSDSLCEDCGIELNTTEVDE